MNWMFEHRSKDYYYDDDSEGGGLPTIKWYQVLLFPFLMLPIAFILAISDALFTLVMFVSYFYNIAKNVSEGGKLDFPNLAYIGAWIAIILPILISNDLFDVSDHPIMTFCALILVILFTIAPLTGLVWRFFKRIKSDVRYGD